MTQHMMHIAHIMQPIVLLFEISVFMAGSFFQMLVVIYVMDIIAWMNRFVKSFLQIFNGACSAGSPPDDAGDLAAAGDAQLAEEVGYVLFRGVAGDEQRFADLPVGKPHL